MIDHNTYQALFLVISLNVLYYTRTATAILGMAQIAGQHPRECSSVERAAYVANYRLLALVLVAIIARVSDIYSMLDYKSGLAGTKACREFPLFNNRAGSL